MKMNCAFTICTKSYRGLAETLKNSFLKFNENFDFYIIYIDDLENENNSLIKITDIMYEYISANKFYEMAFKYDLTEFCTSVKPFIIRNFLEKKYELVIYLDPDICFYSKFNEILDNSKSIYITPHINTAEEKYSGDDDESNILQYGIYNCGFIGFRNSSVSSNILKWWSQRLLEQCYADSDHGLFTDQKWIDFLPAIVSEKDLMIIHNLGCNLAPWNFYERRISKIGETYKISNRLFNSETTDLCFVHFSGFNYKELCSGKINHKWLDNNYSDVKTVVEDYRLMLLSNNAEKYFSIQYKFNNFSNGLPIMKIHRRVFRTIIENEQLDNPFLSSNEFYKKLKKNHFISKKVFHASNTRNLNNFSKKEKIIFLFFKFVFSILRINLFEEFLLGIHKYSTLEYQENILHK